MKSWIIFVIALVIAVLDQLSKFVVRRSLNFTTNTGAAFGILQGQRWPLIVVTAIIAVVLIIAIAKYHYVELGFILGGAAGNLIDRAAFGYVVDFIDVGWWPSFNVADSFNTIGIILLVLRSLKKH